MVRMRKFLLLNVPGSDGGAAPVLKPPGFTLSLPFVVQRVGTNFRAWDTSTSAVFDVTTLAPTAGVTYYVSTTGSDSNDGLSADAPLRKIVTALQKGDVGRVYVAAGVYDYSNGWAGLDLSKSVSVIATGGRAVLTGASLTTALTWELDVAGGNANTWKANRTGVFSVYDNSITDSNNDAQKLIAQASAADVEDNPGSWYTDATSVWVRTTDSRKPDNNIYLLSSAVAYVGELVGNASGAVLYVEGLDFVGGGVHTFFSRADSSGNMPTLYAKNCTFKYGSDANMAIRGTFAILQNCIVAHAENDGISYKAYNGALANGVEIDVIGRDNGVADDIDNGSTMHDGGAVFRLNSEYMRNAGPNVQDIGDGTLSWNVACNAHDSASDVNNDNWVVGGSATTSTMWLDSCSTSGSAVDLTSEDGAVLYIRNTPYTTASVAGTITTY